MKRLTSLSWLLVALACVAWCCVGFFAWTISGDDSDRAQNLTNAQQSSDQQALTTRMHALAQDSASDRSALSTILNVDVVSAVDTVQAAGTAAGVSLKLSDASPEGASSAASSELPVQAIAFTVQGDGTFSSLMRAVQLLETLPIPSSLDGFDISATPGSSGPPSWHLEASIQILTTASISS